MSIKHKIGTPEIKNKLLRMLTKRDHSVFEMKKKLRNYYDFETSHFDEAIEWLKNLKYLPDENALSKKLETYFRTKGKSQKWIKAKLLKKGLKWGTTLYEEEEAQAAQVFIEKKIKNRSLNELNFEEKMTLKRKLATQGFSLAVINNLIK